MALKDRPTWTTEFDFWSVLKHGLPGHSWWWGSQVADPPITVTCWGPGLPAHLRQWAQNLPDFWVEAFRLPTRRLHDGRCHLTMMFLFNSFGPQGRKRPDNHTHTWVKWRSASKRPIYSIQNPKKSGLLHYQVASSRLQRLVDELCLCQVPEATGDFAQLEGIPVDHHLRMLVALGFYRLPAGEGRRKTKKICQI